MTTFLGTWETPGKPAVETAWRAFQGGANLREWIEQGLAVCEMDPTFLAIGLGSLPNSDGEIELDAAMMDGENLECGGVCSVRGIVPVISVAKKVLEETPHNLLAGEQARRFAISKGFTPRNLVTEEIARQYEKWRAGVFPDEYMHSTSDLHGDTVTMLGLHDGHCVAASSTSGLAWKLPGRVGDSPIFGAGLYADDEIGCAGATGLGEELWKAMASYRATRNMEAGMSAQEACDEVIQHMIRRLPNACVMSCVVLALRKDGDFGAAITTGKFDLWVCQDGEVSTHKFESDK